MIEVVNIYKQEGRFNVMQTGKHVQTAVMKLDAGQQSSAQPNSHPGSEQMLLVLEGTVTAEINGEQQTLTSGDVVIVPEGAPHRFINDSGERCVTFTSYSPPDY